MMNWPIIRWLLDINAIPADADSLTLAWENPFPGWVWALLLLGAAAYAAWSYTRLTGSRLGKAALAAVRFAIIALILVLISGPMLEMPRETVEEDWLLLLIDRSASMNIADGIDGTDDADDNNNARITRDQQLRKALTQHHEMLASLSEQKQLVWLGFHLGAFSLDAGGPSEGGGANAPHPATPSENNIAAANIQQTLPVTLGQADGRRTSIDTSIMQALQRAAARPVSGIVLISDGRTYDPPTRATVRRLQADAIPVFTVPVGSADALADLSIGRIDSPRRAYIGDKVPITVQLDRANPNQTGPATITLMDQQTGQELAREVVAAGDQRSEITLTAEPRLAGQTTWRIEIETDEPALVPENMVRSFDIDLIDRPLRVLFVDGYPRWEFRYLRNLMIRENSLESSTLLLSADKEFAQEGDIAITRLPRSPGELADYDVIVLGDVPASFFTSQQLEMIRDHVADNGAGLLWIAGPRWTPNTFAATALADVLPIRGSAPITAIGRPVLMQSTDLANRLGVLQLSTGGAFGWPEELTDASYNWSQLRYAQRLERSRLKPTVEVLAETTERFGQDPLALVTMMRYGAGTTVYVATDEIWRWRYGRGELLPEQFWVQLLRMLGRQNVAGSGQQMLLEVNPRRLEVNQPLRIQLRILDDQLAAQRLRSIGAELINQQGETVAELELMRISDNDERFAATWLPDNPGRYRVHLRDAAFASMAGDAPVEVFAPDDEMRRPETDHALLANLAQATGGQMLSVDQLNDLPDLLPNRAIRTVNPLRERIWDTPFFFALLIGALTIEWIGRKIMRLV